VFFKRTPQFQPLSDIPVRTTRDRDNPFLTSIALLSSDRLVVGDHDNRSVKLFDVVQDEVLHQLRVDSTPLSVCSLPGTRAAVALPFDNTILILNCDNELSIVNRITVQEDLQELRYSNGHLIVLYNFGKIEKLHMNGAVVRQTNLETSSLHIYLPLSVMTEGNVTSIYVGDYDNRRILRLDEDLQEQQVYPVPDGAEPWGVLAVEENQLLVSDRNDRLWQLDTTMGRWTHLKQKEWFKGAYTMAFCHDRHVLYFSVINAVKRFAIS